MNIEAYNLDSLRKLVRDLEKENKELRKLLDKAEIPYANNNAFTENIVDFEEYDLDQGGRINSQYIDKQLATKFFSMFWGREDVFAKRAKNGSYYPQCDNRWNNELCPKQRNEKMYCEDCEHKCWTRLSPEIIQKHLLGYRDDGADVDALNLTPRLQNQIRCMATFGNPVFYKNKRLGYSNYYNFSMVYMGEDVDGYIKIPRGLLEDILSECKSTGIDYDVVDDREIGRPIRVQFNGELRVQQDLAAQRILSYDNGILNAATAFGKTVVCSYLEVWSRA